MKLEETKEYKDYIAKRNEKAKSIKRGDDVVHLNYYSWIIAEPELADYQQKLKEVNLRLSSYNEEGDMHASLEDFKLETFLALGNATVLSILNGTITNLTWDTIKYIALNFWNKVRRKPVTKFSNGQPEQKPLSFGMKVRIGEHTEFDFELNGDVSEQTILKSLDKSLKFIAQQKENERYKLPYFVKYDEQTESWKAIDVEEELRKRHSK